MDTVNIVQFILSFAFVVGLIYAVAWVVKKLGIDRKFHHKTPDEPTLSVSESLMIDPRHRVVLIRRGKREHMVMLGQAESTVIESYDVDDKD